MKMMVNYIACLLALLLHTACQMEHEPIKTIANLKNVSEIKFSKSQPPISFVITEETAIRDFLTSFRPARSGFKQKKDIDESGFVKDGEIRIFFKDERERLIIDIDFDKGYRIRIGLKIYYELFTYQTGRYLAENFSKAGKQL